MESAPEGFRADHLMAAAVGAEPERALLRLWSRPARALSVGRYHRIGDASDPGMQRRLSGGRVVPIGPGVLGVTLAVASSQWLAPGAARLRPDQILNRALRPLLASLRALGVDAFYPGRDLVTSRGRPVAYAAFCPFADGVVLIEQLVALNASFAEIESLATVIDPEGVTGIAPGAFAESVTLEELGAARPRSWWLSSIVENSAAVFRVESVILDQPPNDLAIAVPACADAYRGFARERRACAAGKRRVSGLGQLGLVEAAASVDDGVVSGLEITGDLIAAFATLEAVTGACEGQPAEAAVLRRTVLREVADEGRFVLGVRDLEELVARLA